MMSPCERRLGRIVAAAGSGAAVSNRTARRGRRALPCLIYTTAECPDRAGFPEQAKRTKTLGVRDAVRAHDSQPAAATPISRLAVDTMPSLAPNTAARSHPMRRLR
jgi:hypothetical protein